MPFEISSILFLSAMVGAVVIGKRDDKTVAEKFVKDVLEQLPSAQTVELKISKINPPIGGKCRRASISILKRRS